MAAASRIYTTLAPSTSPSSLTRYSTSWLLPPLYLFLLRALIALWASITIFVALALEGPSGTRRSFSYFTILGYWGIAFYTLFAAYHTLSYHLKGQSGGSTLHSWPKVLVYAHQALHASVLVFPIVVTIVFWGVLSEGALSSRFSTWANVSEHALNSVIAVMEMLLTRADPLQWVLLLPLVVVLALYLGLAYLTHATEGFYVYAFLDPKYDGRGLVAGACVGILVGMILVFVVVHFVMKLRLWVTETKLGMYGKLSTRDEQCADSGELEEANLGMIEVSTK